MPATVLAQTIVVTKNSTTGNFQFQFLTPQGAVRFYAVLLSADMATAAALTSGNSTTLTYSQDGTPTGPTRADYPDSYVQQTF